MPRQEKSRKSGSFSVYTRGFLYLKKEQNLKKLLVLVLIFSINFAGLSFPRAEAVSGVPRIISYQGRLTDASGNLLGGSGGTEYSFKFSIWNDNVATSTINRVWPTTNPGIATSTVTSGVFNINIGDTANNYPDALTYDFYESQDVYLQVEVSDDGIDFETLSPRQRIGASGFAVNADTLSGKLRASSTADYTFDVINDGSGRANLNTEGQIKVGNFSAAPTAIGGGSLYYNTATGQLFVWNDVTSTPAWVSVGGATGGASTDLQAAYNLGNTIQTTSNRNILFTLAPAATSSNFVINISATSTGIFQIQASSSAVFSMGRSLVTSTAALSWNIQGPTTLATTTITNLTISNATTTGNLHLSGAGTPLQVTAGTSALQGLTFTTATGTQLTATTLISSGSSTISLLNFTTATGTSANIGTLTGTGFIFTSGTSTNFNFTTATGTTARIGTLTLTNALGIASGGTGTSSVPTNGQLLIGNGTDYSLATLTPGTAIGIQNAAGTITITNLGVQSATAGTGISVSSATGTVTFTNTRPFVTSTLSGLTDTNFIFTAGSGMTIGTSTSPSTITFTNNGVRTLTAGTNITVTSATGTPTIAVTTTPSFSSLGVSGTVSIGTTTLTGNLSGLGMILTGRATTSQLSISGITGSTQCLRVDLNGIVSGAGQDCGTGGGTPGGATTQIQYNNGGTFAGDSNFLWASSTKNFTITGTSTLQNVTFTVATGTSANIGTLTLNNALGVASGGSGAGTFSRGILIASGTNAFASLSGADGKVLTASSAAPFGFAFETVSSTGGSGIQELNGLISSPQFFATSTNYAGGFNIQSAASTHTFNFPGRINDINGLATTTGNLIVGNGTSWASLLVGTNGYVLTASSTASNGIAWQPASGSGTPGGATTQIQYNNAGTFAGDANFLWASSTKLFTVSGTSSLDNVSFTSATGTVRLTLSGASTPLQVTAGTSALQGLTFTTATGTQLTATTLISSGSSTISLLNFTTATGTSANIGTLTGTNLNYSTATTTNLNFTSATGTTRLTLSGASTPLQVTAGTSALQGLTFTTATGTSLTLTGLGTGLVKSTGGILGNATSGTDYELPLTFGTPLARNGNAVSFAGTFATSGASNIQIASSSGTWTFSQATSSASTNGFLSAADFLTFSNKQGVTTTIAAGGTTITGPAFTFATTTNYAGGFNIQGTTFNFPGRINDINNLATSSSNFIVSNGTTWTAISSSSLGLVPTSRTITAGSNLLGGGALTSDLTLYWNASVATATISTATTTNLNFTTATGTSANIGTLTGTGYTFTNGTTTNLNFTIATGTNANITTLTGTNIQYANATTTGNHAIQGALNVTGQTTLGNLNFTNATGTGNFHLSGAGTPLQVTAGTSALQGLTFTTATGTSANIGNVVYNSTGITPGANFTIGDTTRQLTLQGATTTITAEGANSIVFSTNGSEKFRVASSVIMIGTTATTTTGRISLVGATVTATSAVSGIYQESQLNNSNLNQFQFGNRHIVNLAPTATSSLIGEFVRMVDNTTLGNTVHGMQIQAWSGSNIQGVNTGLWTAGRTFGLQAFTNGSAGGVSQPAAIYGETTTSTQGQVMRLYSDDIASSSQDFAQFYQEISTFQGTGLKMDFARTGGAFTGNYLHFLRGSTTTLAVNATGTLMIGTSTPYGVSNLVVCAQTNCTLPTGSSTVAVFASTDGTSSGASITARGTIIGQVADVGEYVEVSGNPESYEVGHLLSVDSSTSTKFRKSNTRYDRGLAGIITPASAFIAGGEIADSERAVIMALAGRVKVKVTGENGPIESGSLITASSKEGFGMKAVKAGRVVGMALESFAGETETDEGIIMVFVNPHWNLPSLVESLQGGDSGTVEINTFAFGDDAKITIGTIVAGKIFAKNLTVGSEEEPGGITMFDRKTKQPYCLVIEDGATKTYPGKCEGNAFGGGSTLTPIQGEAVTATSTSAETTMEGSVSIPITNTTGTTPTEESAILGVQTETTAGIVDTTTPVSAPTSEPTTVSTSTPEPVIESTPVSEPVVESTPTPGPSPEPPLPTTEPTPTT